MKKAVFFFPPSVTNYINLLHTHHHQEHSEYSEYGDPPHDHEVLDHLLAQVVVDAVYLLLLEETAEVLAQLGRTGRVLAKRLLNYHSIPPTEREREGGREGERERVYGFDKL